MKCHPIGLHLDHPVLRLKDYSKAVSPLGEGGDRRKSLGQAREGHADISSGITLFFRVCHHVNIHHHHGLFPIMIDCII